MKDRHSSKTPHLQTKPNCMPEHQNWLYNDHDKAEKLCKYCWGRKAKWENFTGVMLGNVFSTIGKASYRSTWSRRCTITLLFHSHEKQNMKFKCQIFILFQYHPESWIWAGQVPSSQEYIDAAENIQRMKEI